MKPLALMLLLLVALPAVRADHRDDERENRRDEPRVILYEHADFRGASLVLYPGDSIDNFSGQGFPSGAKLNDSVSSIRVEGGAEVLAYENARFRGNALRLTESARDLTDRLLPGGVSANWNDRISSLRVEGGRRRGGGGGNREIDSDLVIKRAFSDLLGREPSAQELRRFRGQIIDQGWTERMLRDHLRSDDGFRREAADAIILRAFRDLLSRVPDLSGLGGLRSLIVDRGWTEEMVRDNIRRGDEFRNEGASRIVRQAFLEVLGREPNGEELAKYRRRLLDDKWLGPEVREDLKRSAEYPQKPNRR